MVVLNIEKRSTEGACQGENNALGKQSVSVQLRTERELQWSILPCTQKLWKSAASLLQHFVDSIRTVIETATIRRELLHAPHTQKLQCCPLHAAFDCWHWRKLPTS